MHGKTGSGDLLSDDRTRKTEIQHGWYVGWIEKDGRKILLANHIVDDSKQDSYAGPRAKEIAKEKLLDLIKGL
jgi:beta-lactamase class D